MTDEPASLAPLRKNIAAMSQAWYEEVSTYSPGALQVMLDSYEAQMAQMATKVDYLRLLIALDSRPPDPLPVREKPMMLLRMESGNDSA